MNRSVSYAWSFVIDAGNYRLIIIGVLLIAALVTWIAQLFIKPDPK